MKIYIVQYVYERNITTLGVGKTEEEAKKILKDDFERVLEERDYDITEKWSYDGDSAWINSDYGSDCNWQITEIEA